MPRRKTKRTRRRKSFSILNGLEALAYATIMTEGIAGTSPWGFITGKADLKGAFEGQFLQMTSGSSLAGTGSGSDNGGITLSGEGEISLGDLATNPGTALTAMGINFSNNLLPMAIAGFTTAISFKVGKRLLRRPISSINRNIISPALGAGIKL